MGVRHRHRVKGSSCRLCADRATGEVRDEAFRRGDASRSGCAKRGRRVRRMELAARVRASGSAARAFLWRRRESNPRPRTHRSERLQACSAIGSRPTAGGGRPTGGPAILGSRTSGDGHSFGAEPVRWRRYPNHGPNSERRRYLTLVRRRVRDFASHLHWCRWIYEANRRPRLAALPENRPRRNQVAPVCVHKF